MGFMKGLVVKKSLYFILIREIQEKLRENFELLVNILRNFSA